MHAGHMETLPNLNTKEEEVETETNLPEGDSAPGTGSPGWIKSSQQLVKHRTGKHGTLGR